MGDRGRVGVAAQRLGRLGVALDGEAAPGVEPAVQDQPRPGRVAIDQPRLLEERDPQGAGVVGDGRLDQRPHPPPPDRASSDPADLHDDRRGLLRREIRDRPRLAPVAWHVLEQVADGVQAERLRALPGLGAVELQQRRQPARSRVADRRELSSSRPNCVVSAKATGSVETTTKLDREPGRPTI